MYYRIFAFIGLLTILFSGCNSNSHNKDQLIDSKVVSNPNSATEESDRSLLPFITFEDTVHDFGRIIEGESVSFNFMFTNTGKQDLVIADVSTSCGCTVPSYPKTAINPGESGSIRISFDSKGRRGFQTKTIVVVANTQPNVTQLKIKAQVLVPGAE